MPEGSIYVGRPSRWGNVWTIGHVSPWGDGYLLIDAEEAVRLYRYVIDTVYGRRAAQVLRGHDLACWCPLCEDHADGLPLGVECATCPPCHADVLLELANR